MIAKAVTRRLDAIKTMTERHLTPTGQLRARVRRADVLVDIDWLRALGRTERWQASLDRWEAMVRDTKNPLDWAILQGAIYAGYGAL